MLPEIIPKNFINSIAVGRSANSVAHTIIERLLWNHQKVHIIDCAIRLRAMQIAEATKGMDVFALHNITLQRAFTPYQLLDLFNTISTSYQRNETERVIQIFLAPSKQFFDGDVKKDERVHLLKILTQKLERFVQLQIPFIFSESTPKDDVIYYQYIRNLEKCGKIILLPEIQPKQRGKIYGQNHKALLKAN
ncbi:hypothetical protein EHQ23_09075 [Leptospira bourretii]|uniref:Uncharacterized protein n=1 Tax=Leptospira bourretii TaxID=2484962 RepID=A0A4R9IL15_9LEPT|nr:hypothetical protein [Leptospira bourretii]TGK84838.1 hypothetical protein EHQ23_09075 [Leptospira bourretii]TGK90605.1 hypothetical protein EHQ26_10675 [Leptospira bourretii]TGL33708.1 hypothetical protein EHQ45_09420 [Leptospira bourretii]